MEIKDRIRMIMEREKVPPRVFAETIGVQQSTLSHILNDRNKPSLEVVMKVHQTYNYVNLEWLLYGKGEMFIPESRENEIRAFFENALSSDTDLAKIQRKFINTLISLDKEEWIVLDRFMKKYHFNQK